MLRHCFTKNISGIILVFCFLLSLTSCGSKKSLEKYTEYSFDYFDTVTTVVGYAESSEEFSLIFEEIKAELSRYHKLFDIYKTYDGITNLADVNALYDGKHKELKVDKEIIDLVIFSKEMYEKTNGRVNIAFGSVLKLWHNVRTDAEKDINSIKLPSNEELKKAAKHTNIEDVVVNKEKSTIFLADDKLTLDVGAIAKGYAVEKVCDLLVSKNITGYIINVGGNIKTVGTHPTGEEFLVGIENPDTKDDNKPYLEKVYIKNKSVVTSGSYQRYFTLNGKNYHHIIDTATLMPSEKGFRLVSVICEDSAVGDALSTALFCTEKEKAEEILKNFSNLSVIWLTQDGNTFKTGEFKSGK